MKPMDRLIAAATPDYDPFGRDPMEAMEDMRRLERVRAALASHIHLRHLEGSRFDTFPWPPPVTS